MFLDFLYFVCVRLVCLLEFFVKVEMFYICVVYCEGLLSIWNVVSVVEELDFSFDFILMYLNLNVVVIVLDRVVW